MEDAKEKILAIRVRYDDALRDIAKYSTEIDRLKRNEEALKKLVKDGTITRESFNMKMAESKIATKEYNDAIRVLEKEVLNNVKTEKEQEGSLKSLRAQLSNLTAKYDEMSRAERNSAKGKELLNHINEVTDELKEAEEESQRFYRNVGNYEEAFSNAIVSGNSFIGNLKSMTEGTGGVVGGIKSMTSAAMKFIMTPIGAVVTALALIFKGLSLGISSSEENTAKFNQILAPFKVIMDALLNVLQTVVGWWLDWVSVILKAYSAIGKFFAGLVGMTEQYDKMNAKIQEGIQLEKDKLQLSKDTRKANEENKKIELEVSELRTQAAKKDKYSHQERITFLDEAIKKETSVAETRKQLAERNLAIMEAEAARAGNTEETEQKLSEARIAVTQATIDLNNKTRELTAQRVEAINAMKAETKAEQEKAKEKAKAAAEAAKEAKEKEIEAIRQAEDAMTALMKDGLGKQRKETNDSYNRQIEDLRRKLATEKNLTVKAREAINKTIKLLEQNREKDLKKLSDDEVAKEIEKQSKIIEYRLTTIKAGSDEELALKLQQLELQKQVELKQAEELGIEKSLIEAKYRKQADDLVKKADEDMRKKQLDEVRLQFENKIAEAQIQGKNYLQIQVEQRKAELDSLQQMEGESDAAFKNRQLEARSNYVNAQKELADYEVSIQEKKANAIISVMNGLMDLTEVMGEKNKAAVALAKMLAVAEVAITQGVAIAHAVKTATASSATWVDMLAAIGTVIAGVTAVMGTAMKSIKSAKFAQGGAVTGPGSGTSDSIPASLSNGESVMTAAATSMFAPILSSFNILGGGVPINVQASSAQAIGEDMLARAVAKGFMMAPAPVLSVEEYTSVANRVKYVENIGDI